MKRAMIAKVALFALVVGAMALTTAYAKKPGGGGTGCPWRCRWSSVRLSCRCLLWSLKLPVPGVLVRPLVASTLVVVLSLTWN